ncbi:hypothetical protein Emag_007067 [Eimeria magna]
MRPVHAWLHEVVPLPLLRGSVLTSFPHYGDRQDGEMAAAPFHHGHRPRRDVSLVTALAAMAVASVVFFVLHCHLWKVRAAETQGHVNRGLASGGDEQEDDSEKPSGLASDICGRSAEGEEEEHRKAAGPSRAAPERLNATAETLAASHGVRQREGKRSRDKTAATSQVVLKLARSLPEQHEERQGPPSEGTEILSYAQTPPYDVPDPEEGSPAKKTKSEGAVAGQLQVAAREESVLGESSLNSESIHSKDLEIPSSLLELYLNDMLQEGVHESIFADWLLDPDDELPQSPAPPGETRDWPTGADVVSSELFPSYNFRLLAEATALVGEQEQAREAAQTRGPHISSTSMSSEVKEKYDEKPPVAVVKSAVTGLPSTSAGSAALGQLSLRELLKQIIGEAAALPKPLPLNQHPFYRMPNFWPQDVTLPPLTPFRHLSSRPRGHLSDALERVRAILAKERLDEADIRCLQETGKNLLAFAGRYLSSALSKQFTSRLVKNLTLRVLVAHYLLAVCQVVGPSMRKEAWWFYSMNRVLAPPVDWRPQPLSDAGQGERQWGTLLHTLHEAMCVLRRGERLSPDSVVYIMRQTFCVPPTLRYFQGPDWEGWRQAERNFAEGKL